MTRQPCLIVPGTWSARQRRRPGEPRYFDPGGSFVELLEANDYYVLGAGNPRWSTKLEGTVVERLFWKRLVQQQWLSEWYAGGRDVCDELRRLSRPEDLVAFVHSHGLYPLITALARADCPPIWALCSIGSPDRADMQEQMVLARDKIRGPWLHLIDGSWRDYWKILGTVGTGSLFDTLGYATGISDGPRLADRRDKIKGVGHTALVEDPRRYRHWTCGGRLEYLRRSPRRLATA